MRVCVDTTALIDILKDEFPAYQERLYSALERNEELVAPSIIIAELMPQFKGDLKLLNTFVREHKIAINPLDVDSAAIAGARWMDYLKRKSQAACLQCGHLLDKKEHFLSDFYIGGYALAHCDAILTRDRGIYKKYFRDLKGYENCL